MLVAVAAFAGKGLFRGFFREAFGLAALVAGCAATLLVGADAAAELTRQATVRWELGPGAARVLVHAALFLVPFLVLHAAGFVLHKLGRAVFLGGLDRLAGGLLGCATGILLAGACLAFLAQWPGPARWLAGSRLAPPLMAVFRGAAQWLWGTAS